MYLQSFGCDLLKNSYLCGAININRSVNYTAIRVVICLKIRIFVVQSTSLIFIVFILFVL